jgi:hypothetical protein
MGEVPEHLAIHHEKLIVNGDTIAELIRFRLGETVRFITDFEMGLLRKIPQIYVTRH